MKYDIYMNNLSANNCNCRLTELYSVRDRISSRIDKLIVMGYDTTSAEAEYDEICNVINNLCNFRRTHDCLLEGDKGYGFN